MATVWEMIRTQAKTVEMARAFSGLIAIPAAEVIPGFV